MTSELITSKEQQLIELATSIDKEHKLCEEAARSSLQHAINAGNLLLKAKKLCQHGTWGKWLEENCTVSERTAQVYMRLAQGLPILETKAQHVADLSLREAVALLAEPKQGYAEARVEMDRIEAHIEAARTETRKLAEGLSSKLRLLLFCELREDALRYFDREIAAYMTAMLAEDLRIGLTETAQGIELVALI